MLLKVKQAAPAHPPQQTKFLRQATWADQNEEGAQMRQAPPRRADNAPSIQISGTPL